jgi:hypothetical protein
MRGERPRRLLLFTTFVIGSAVSAPNVGCPASPRARIAAKVMARRDLVDMLGRPSLICFDIFIKPAPPFGERLAT